VDHRQLVPVRGLHCAVRAEDSLGDDVAVAGSQVRAGEERGLAAARDRPVGDRAAVGENLAGPGEGLLAETVSAPDSTGAGRDGVIGPVPKVAARLRRNGWPRVRIDEAEGSPDTGAEHPTRDVATRRIE